MIEIVTNKERNLRNVTQIGTPREDNKIYIENLAYTKLKDDVYAAKNVFVLMGHTECMENRYITFVEAVIPVNTIDFTGNLPKWNDYVWKDVFREIKRLYEDMIIVGWALDIKGMTPKVTPELERIHKEHFGGIHQLMFLLDTLEGEEAVYVQKGNTLVAKDGFYIYYCTRAKSESTEHYEAAPNIETIPITRKKPDYEQRRNVDRLIGLERTPHQEAQSTRQEKRIVQMHDYEKENYENHNRKSYDRKNYEKKAEPSVELDVNFAEWTSSRGGKYRQMLKESEQKKGASSGTNVGIAIAAAMLVFVIGVGIYENGDALWNQADKAVESMSGNVEAEDTQTEETQTSTETGTIPVEIISGENP